VLNGGELSCLDPAQALNFLEIKVKADFAKVKAERDKMSVTSHRELQERPALYELDSTVAGDLQKSAADVNSTIEPQSAAAPKK
jgi:hypothetical protein